MHWHGKIWKKYFTNILYLGALLVWKSKLFWRKMERWGCGSWNRLCFPFVIWPTQLKLLRQESHICALKTQTFSSLHDIINLASAWPNKLGSILNYCKPLVSTTLTIKWYISVHCMDSSVIGCQSCWRDICESTCIVCDASSAASKISWLKKIDCGEGMSHLNHQ